MDSGRLIFDSAPSHHHGRMLVLGGAGMNPIFRGARSVLGVEEGGSKLQPFFTSPEELMEEEYYDEQLPEKKRRLTPEQVHLLERSFETENKLEPERKSELARKLGLQQRQVAVWFQNRRARWKTKQLERDYGRLKASFDALAADRDTLLKDNDRLRSQVISLTEKLQAKEPPAVGKLETDQGSAVFTVEDVAFHAQEEQQQQQQQQKVEDRLSTGGSRGSTVVDGECPQLVDSSGESYFQESYQRGCYLGVQSEEDDGSDDGCSCLPAAAATDLFAVEHQTTESWWVWN